VCWLFIFKVTVHVRSMSIFCFLLRPLKVESGRRLPGRWEADGRAYSAAGVRKHLLTVRWWSEHLICCKVNMR